MPVGVATEPPGEQGEGMLRLFQSIFTKDPTREGRYPEAIAEYKQFREGVPGCAICGLFELAGAFDRADQADSAWATNFTRARSSKTFPRRRRPGSRALRHGR